MIAEKDKKIIHDIARKYHASRVLLFGSSLSDSDESRDIDLAIEGVADKDFYAFYGELLYALSKPVDIVDVSRPTKFNELVLKEGIALYG
jgi:predicted nucleotidyltransferase